MEPFSLAALGAAALGQGITFLFNQAGEVLRIRRERRDNPAASPVPQTPTGATDVLEGELVAGSLDLEALDRRGREILSLQSVLLAYANGYEPVDPANQELLRAASDLRAALEEIYGQTITFRGESRAKSGRPLIKSQIGVRKNEGSIHGITADVVPSNTDMKSRIDVGENASGGTVEGINIGVGATRPPRAEG